MGADHNIDHYLVVGAAKERLAVIQQTLHKCHMEKFSLKKLNELEGEEQG
jgi:hypothetical protein